MNAASHPAGSQTTCPDDPDTGLILRAGHGDHGAFEALMRRHNQRLFRVARAILKDDAEAEDAVQEAYLDVYQHAGGFRGDSRGATWLTRVVVNRALRRLRGSRSRPALVPLAPANDMGPSAGVQDGRVDAEPADGRVLRAEIRRMIERRIDQLPVTFRAVFVMRDVEEMTGQEVADALDLPEATVRTRLFRARALLRAALERDMDMAARDVFAFADARCDRIVATVLSRLPDDPRG